MRKLGIDISKWQGSFKNQGNINFIIQKVSEGLAYDAKYWEMLPDVQTVELRGAYHYFRTSVNPIEQADFFNQAQGGQGFHFLVMDYEGHGNTLDRSGAENLMRFYQKLRSLTTKPILLYTTEYILRDNLLIWNNEWLHVPLWVARYNAGLDEHTASPLFLELGNDWVIWQYSAAGNKKGADYGVGSTDVDLNVINDDCFIPAPPEQEEPEMKKWYQSKTLWFSIVFGIVSLAGAFGFDAFVPSPEVAQYVGLAVSVIVAILRIFTNQGIEK